METLTGKIEQNVSLGLTAADAVWIATASLHERYPDAIGFSPIAIRNEVFRENLTSAKAETVYQHIVQHLVATQPRNPNRRRMLTDVGDGMRRLFLPSDDFHPSKNGAQFTPKTENLPPHLRGWLNWYDSWSQSHPAKREPAPAINLMDALEGTWTFGDADSYLRELREGWE